MLISMSYACSRYGLAGGRAPRGHHATLVAVLRSLVYYHVRPFIPSLLAVVCYYACRHPTMLAVHAPRHLFARTLSRGMLDNSLSVSAAIMLASLAAGSAGGAAPWSGAAPSSGAACAASAGGAGAHASGAAPACWSAAGPAAAGPASWAPPAAAPRLPALLAPAASVRGRLLAACELLPLPLCRFCLRRCVNWTPSAAVHQAEASQPRSHGGCP